jgi:2-keto-4-pentenoate hydratase/2-oxohepta-3-ene-1,7-dioic acid hydratase in catechol pathway
VKFASFVHEGRTVVGLVDAERRLVWPLDRMMSHPITTMAELIERYVEVEAAIRPNGHAVSLDSVTLLAPIPRPVRNVLCVGKNYRDHAQEFTRSGFDSSASSSKDAIPEAPYVFTKPPETVIGQGHAIRYPTGISDSIDYEAELGVVIGKKGRGIRRSDAYDHVWGYTIVNDVTARDWQARHKQWFLGKSFDTFCPMGPWIVTADEVEPENLQVRCWVNGELRQDANTRDLIFDIPTLIETLSAGMTLVPGDVIATGTPAGVGIGFTPPRYLKPGDEVSIEITGLGRLTNPVV